MAKKNCKSETLANGLSHFLAILNISEKCLTLQGCSDTPFDLQQPMGYQLKDNIHIFHLVLT